MSAPEQLNVGQAMRLAETMYDRGQGGWSIQGIQHYLTRRGVKRSWQTVKRWADPAYAEQARTNNRLKERTRWGRRTDGRLGRRDHSPDFKLARMLALHNEAGLSLSAIARLMSFDYGVEFTRPLVERAVTSPGRAGETGRILALLARPRPAPSPGKSPSIPSQEEAARA